MGYSQQYHVSQLKVFAAYSHNAYSPNSVKEHSKNIIEIGGAYNVLHIMPTNQRKLPYSYIGASWPRGCKTFSMLNSAEHEILNAHKYKKISRISAFLMLR